MRWSLGMVFLFATLLSACGNEPYDFSGKYVATLGDNCDPDTKSKSEQVFLEILARIEEKSKVYEARLPTEIVMALGGLPIRSNQASPSKTGELQLSFLKQGQDGFFSGSPSVDMVISLNPDTDRANHIWLARWEAAITKNGFAKQINFLDEIKRANVADKGSIVGSKGICLRKLGT